MASEQWAEQERSSVFTSDDRLMHTTKMVERSFGRSVEEVGRVEMDGDRAVLVVSYGGREHKLRWSRQGNGSIFWFVDDNPTPLVLGTSDSAARRLVERLSMLG